MSASDGGLETVDAAVAAERSGDGRHLRVVTVVADAHPHPPPEIDALDLFEEAVHEMLPGLFAVGDDIDPGVFLLLQHQQRCVPLRLDERLALDLPRCPQHLRRGEPSRLRETACDRRLEHRYPSAEAAAAARLE